MYESTTSCAVVPVLRWTDENGVARSQAGSRRTRRWKLLPVYPGEHWLESKQKTKPTIETGGDDGAFNYSLYVSGLGFWPAGAQRQGGPSEVTGLLPAKLVYALPVYQPSVSTSALLVAYSTGFAGKDTP